ncbi:MAG: hypothetical protein R3D51_02350 [Hyphomicrobiaceae bacterium]
MDQTLADTLQTVILIAQAVTFGAFCYYSFRALFALRRRAFEVRNPTESISKGLIEDQRATVATFAEFASAPQWRRDRNRLALIVALLFALMGLSAIIAAHTMPEGKAVDSEPVSSP